MGKYKNEPEKVTCRICDKTMSPKGFSTHVKVHDKSYREYVAEHIEDFKQFGWGFCEICEQLTKGRTNKKFLTCSEKCSSIYRSKYLVGKDAPRYGISHTEKSKEKMRSKAKQRLSDPSNHWNYGNATPSRVKKKIKKAQKANAQKDDYVNPMQGKTHSPETIQKIYKHQPTSSAEQIAIDTLQNHDIKYDFQFFLNDNKGNCKAYDFKIKDTNVLIEVDGDYWHGGPGCNKYFEDVDKVKENDKFKDKLARLNNYIVERVWESQLKENPDVLINKLEKHFQ